MFFDPQAHTARGIPLNSVIEGFNNGCKRAERELGISTLLIPCLLRHLPILDGQATWESLRPWVRDGTVRGLGLSSSELGFPPGPYKGIFAAAREAGLNVTAHAGEEGPPSYIASAITDLGVRRIDHGIKLALDKELLEQVAREKIMLTVCPLSNVRLACVKSVSELPIREFLDGGVRFSINSDDPAYFGGYILANYCAVQEAFNLTPEEWGVIVEGSIDGSWCDDKRKAELKGLLEDVLGRWERGEGEGC